MKRIYYCIHQTINYIRRRYHWAEPPNWYDSVRRRFTLFSMRIATNWLNNSNSSNSKNMTTKLHYTLSPIRCVHHHQELKNFTQFDSYEEKLFIFGCDDFLLVFFNDSPFRYYLHARSQPCIHNAIQTNSHATTTIYLLKLLTYSRLIMWKIGIEYCFQLRSLATFSIENTDYGQSSSIRI